MLPQCQWWPVDRSAYLCHPRALIEGGAGRRVNNAEIVPKLIEIRLVAGGAHLLIELGKNGHADRLVRDSDNAANRPILIVRAAGCYDAADGILKPKSIATALADFHVCKQAEYCA